MRTRSAQLLSVEETALVLGIGRSTLYRAVQEGAVPFPVHRIGGTWYVPRRALERLLDGEADLDEAGDMSENDPRSSEVLGVQQCADVLGRLLVLA